MSRLSNEEEVEHWRRSVGELQNSLDLMRQRIEQLEEECEYYKTHGGNAVKAEAYYYLEMLRSISR